MLTWVTLVTQNLMAVHKAHILLVIALDLESQSQKLLYICHVLYQTSWSCIGETILLHFNHSLFQGWQLHFHVASLTLLNTCKLFLILFAQSKSLVGFRSCVNILIPPTICLNNFGSKICKHDTDFDDIFRPCYFCQGNDSLRM